MFLLSNRLLPAVGEKPTPRLLIFDSGVGGLSIFDDVKGLLRDVDIVFACDNDWFPYGKKQNRTLTKRVCYVLDRLYWRYKPNVIVLACNTATTAALNKVRSKIPVPIVGVVPALKPAAKLSKSRVIGLLATPQTIKRPYTQNLINEFARDCTIISIGSVELVRMAEEKLRQEGLDMVRLEKIVAPFFHAESGAKLDTIVLGCTHFPLLLGELQEVAPRPVNWVDSAAAVAKRVKYVLDEVLKARGNREPLDREPVYLAVFTANNSDVMGLTQSLFHRGIKKIDFLLGEDSTVAGMVLDR